MVCELSERCHVQGDVEWGAQGQRMGSAQCLDMSEEEWWLPLISYILGKCLHTDLLAAQVFYEMKWLGQAP